MEHRVQINFRISPEMNMSHTFTHIYTTGSTAEQAENAGRGDADLIASYNEGYAHRAGEQAEEREA